MVSSIKKRTEDRAALKEKTTKAIQAVRNVGATATERQKLGTTESRIISIRLDEYDHRRLKALFASEGIKLASGIKTAALWIAEMAGSGALRVTKAGVIDRRG